MPGRTVTPRRPSATRLRPVEFVTAWLIALATYGVGDGATTLAVVASPHLFEANPVLAGVIAHGGGAGLLAVKAVSIGGCLALSLYFGLRDGDPIISYGVPALLAAVGVTTSLSNLALLA